MSQLCSIHHDIPVTQHIPGAYGQWSVFDHNGDTVGGPGDKIWDLVAFWFNPNKLRCAATDDFVVWSPKDT